MSLSEDGQDPSEIASDSFPPPDEIIVATATRGSVLSGYQSGLLAFTTDADIVYHTDVYRTYFDVDPVPGTDYEVEYVAAEHLSGSACDAVRTEKCTRNVVERVNITSGEATRIYTDEVSPGVHSTRWHDVDRINNTHVVVADIQHDRVTILNHETNQAEWQWNASEEFPGPSESGGPADDWTHINDVEVLADGRVMASLRNHDQVVFIRPGEGLTEDWTLGEDDKHETLYEQHNPDFISVERGGPAILVADSQNNRIVEYHRRDGEWVLVWGWRDSRLQWPRDADRLPNDHLLITDSHGDRVVEIDETGAIVWSVEIPMPYDAERLDAGTGSARQTADTDGAPSIQTPANGYADHASLGLKDLLPTNIMNGLIFVMPAWMGFSDSLVAVISLGALVVWLCFEFLGTKRVREPGQTTSAVTKRN